MPLAGFTVRKRHGEPIIAVGAFADFAIIDAACRFHRPEKARRTDITVIPLADFALIRRWRATFPTRGKASSGCA